MLHSNFATQIVSSIPVGNSLDADNTFKIIEPQTCRVLGFVLHPIFTAGLGLTITIASADQSKTYFVGKFLAGTATHIVHTVPFTADGLAWKSTGAGAFSTFVSSTFFLTQHGS